MSTNVSIEVTGVKEALRELNSIDKQARRGITQRFRSIMKPMLDRGKQLVPREAPLSGFERYWNPRPGRQAGSSGGGILPWQEFNDQRAIDAFVSGKKPKEYAGVTRNLAAFGARWKGPHAVLFDATRRDTELGQRLTARWGQPSRAMWRAMEDTEPEVEDGIRDLINDIMARVGRQVKV